MDNTENQVTQCFEGLSVDQESFAKHLVQVCQELGVAVPYLLIRRQAIAQSLNTLDGREIKGYVLAVDGEMGDGIVDYQHLDCCRMKKLEKRLGANIKSSVIRLRLDMSRSAFG